VAKFLLLAYTVELKPYFDIRVGSGVPLSVWCLITNWTTDALSSVGTNDFSSNLCVQAGSEAHSTSCPVGIMPRTKLCV